MVLDKNIEQILDNDLTHVNYEFLNKNPKIILSSEPFLKTEFLIELIDSIDYPVIFLDFDLLYSGYFFSEMIKKNDRVKIYHPTKTDWKTIIGEIIEKISKERFLIIIDSFNGVYNLIDKNESGRLIHASIMLLSLIGREMETSIVITGFARKKDNLGWILSPGGRHVIDSKKTGIYYLDRTEKNLLLKSLDRAGNTLKIFKIMIPIFKS
jgi:hypothetical protein